MLLFAGWSTFFSMSFQEQLQTLRKAKGLSQEKLAEVLGSFLKEVLSLVTKENPYRGPIIYQNGQYKYHCIINGEFKWFQGHEEIYMVFTIEPMINAGSHEIFIDEDDGWTVLTDDDSLSAQWEHTILVTEDGIEIISR